jgi:hypothetical protein
MTRLAQVIEGSERQQHPLAGTPFIPIALDDLNVAVVPDRLDPEEQETLLLPLPIWASGLIISSIVRNASGTTFRVAGKPTSRQLMPIQLLAKSGTPNVAAKCRR